MPSELQLKIFESGKNIDDLFSVSILSSDILDKAISGERAEDNRFHNMMTFQNLTSEQIKALLEKHPYVSKETLVEYQNIDEDLARYILDTQEFDADVYMALYKHNTFSQEFLTEQIQKSGFKIGQ